VSGVAADDATVHVADPSEAGTVYGRGYFGTVREGGLFLDRYEASYLLEMDRLAVLDDRGRTVDWPSLFRRALRAEYGFGVRYLVYRDLRQRGYVVRTGTAPYAFAVLPRGGIHQKTPAKYWVATYSERAPFSLGELFQLAERAQSARKNLLLAVVDEESDLTFYRVRRPTPSGTMAAPVLTTPVDGWVAEDRVIVFDPAAAEHLGKGLAYGSRIGRRLELSLLEAAYLAKNGQLTLRDAKTHRTVPRDRFERRARTLDARFDDRLVTYAALRELKLVVKTGFKYGAHFRAYPRNPETVHARYLVQAVRDSLVAPWPEIAGAVRVAQGVRKELLLAGVHGESVRFLSLERIRP
jgi:tRNA-intron endonuclease, archaea type